MRDRRVAPACTRAAFHSRRSSHLASATSKCARKNWQQCLVDRLADGVRRLVAGNRVDYVHGTGWFMNAQEVRVEGEHGSHRFKFDHCIVATGAAATPVPDLPYDGKDVLAPEQALRLPELPAALSIVGNDYI